MIKKYIASFSFSLVLIAFAGAEVITASTAYTDGETSMKGYLAYDRSIEGSRPGILVVHEWWGHNEYAQRRARDLAKLGYVALAVDMYGEGKQAAHPEDAGKFSSAVMGQLPVARKRFEAAMEFLKKHDQVDPAKIGAIGYCFGGGVVLHMARGGVDLVGVASFHGSLGTENPAQAGAVKAEMLVCNGADDSFVSAESIQGLKDEMEAAGAKLIFKNYEGAVHSFTNPGADAFGEKFGLPLKYSASADEESWKDMQDFFERLFAE